MSDSIMGLLNPMIALVFAAIFGGLWLRNKESKSALLFFFGHLLLACGFLIFHFSPDPDAVSWTLFMHLVYCAAATCVCLGATNRIGQSLGTPTMLAITVISSGLIVAASFGSDMNARLLAANTAYGLFYALTTQIVGRTGRRHPLDHAIYWLLVITTVQFFVRPQLAVIVGGPMSADAYRESSFYAMLMLFMAIDSLLLSLSLVAAEVFDQWRVEKEEAETDPLSGLKMRRSFESAAMTVLENKADSDAPMSMIVADIDQFKQVNDIWGHQAGDEAIAAFGELIASTVRATDICGRVGGEEFCILVHDCELGPAQRLAERIRQKFAALEHQALGPDIRITASFGVTQWRTGEGYGKLFARADAALYAAKSRGRNRVENAERSDPDAALGANPPEVGEIAEAIASKTAA